MVISRLYVWWEGARYDAGDAEVAYSAEGFLLPDGRFIGAKWTETEPPGLDALEELPLDGLPTDRAVLIVKLGRAG